MMVGRMEGNGSYVGRIALMMTGMLLAASMHLEGALALQGRSRLVNRNTPAWMWEHLSTEPQNQQNMPDVYSGSSFQEFWSGFLGDSQQFSTYDVVAVYVADKFSIWDVPSSHSTSFSSGGSECPYTTLQSIMSSSSRHSWSNSWQPSKQDSKIGIPQALLENESKYRLHVLLPAGSSELVHQGGNVVVHDDSNFDTRSLVGNGRVDVVVMPLQRENMRADVERVRKTDESIKTNAKSTGTNYLAIFTAINDGLRSPSSRARSLAEDVVTTTVEADLMAAGNSGGNNTSKYEVRMTPDIFAGMLITLFLVLVTICGVSCLHTIQTPTQMHTEALPVGKES
eukprot:gb/GECG01014003.1/.p1 GENE.gb/GECG01014003.1/~~gb/GECG01014003.1/.p1  ORF type:complete len:340 (+),score=39.26 gb/GECG01014003.1/:1-1020(+)